MENQSRIDEGTPREKLIRYDFWSLVKALDSGLTHGGAAPDQRAKKIVASMATLQPSERQAVLNILASVVTYLSAIDREAAGGRRDTAGTETVEQASFVRITPSDKPR